jgi:hypothetical protein
MTRDDFNGMMRLLNDAFGGGYSGAGADTWFKILGKYQAAEVRDAIWLLAETSRVKPRIADIIEAMKGNGIVGGGSQAVEPNGCSFCAGSGWASVEVSPGEMVMFRCMCDRGERLNHRHRQLTDEFVRNRYVNVCGELRLRNPVEEQRDAKLAEMPLDEKIAWCRRGLARLAGGTSWRT